MELSVRREPFGYLFFNHENENLYALKTEGEVSFDDPSIFEIPSPSGEIKTPEKIHLRNSYPKSLNVLSAPTYVEFYPTLACNEECRFCYIGDLLNKNGRPFPEEHLEGAMNNIANAGVFQLVILGGEPLTYKPLPKLLDEAKRVGLVTSLSTNGTFNREEVWQRVADYDVHLNVSFHSHVREIQDQIVRRKGGYDKTVDLIKYLLDSGISPHVSTVITKQNALYVVNTVKFLCEMGIQSMSLYHTQGIGFARLYSDECIPFSTFKSLVLESQDAAASYGSSVTSTTVFPFLIDNSLSFETSESLQNYIYGFPDGRRVVYVLNNGDALGTLMQDLKHPDVLGNIIRDPLATIWHKSEHLTKIRSMYPKKACLDCTHYEYCRGGALNNLSMNTEDLSIPQCPIFYPDLVTE